MRLIVTLAVTLGLASGAAAEDSVDALLKQAKDRYANLEYDQVLPLANKVLSAEGVTLDQRIDAYVLQGSALAIVGDNIEAEKSFRLVLQSRPEFDLPADASPRILSILRKVQAEVSIINEQARKSRLAKVIGGLALKSPHPKRADGGLPLAFDYRFKDPTGAIETVRVQYRKQGELAYASLPLERDDEGNWRGSIPGDWTANEGGAVVEYFIETASSVDQLLVIGEGEAPLSLDIAPGAADRGPPPPLPTWGFWTAAATSAGLAAAGLGFGLGTLAVQADYEQRLIDSASGNPEDVVDGAVTERELRPLGNALAATATTLYIAAGVGVVATVVMMPFTNWSE